MEKNVEHIKKPYKGFKKHLAWLRKKGATSPEGSSIYIGDFNQHISDSDNISFYHAHQKRMKLYDEGFIDQKLVNFKGYRIWLTEKGERVLTKKVISHVRRKEQPPKQIKKEVSRKKVSTPKKLKVRKRKALDLLKKRKKRIKPALREIKFAFSSPQPEITVFNFGTGKFFPYSTSEEEEQQDSSYFTALAALYSAGRNITKAMKGISSNASQTLEDSEMYTLLPVGRDVLYVGKVAGRWLFSIKTKRFSQELFSPPREDAMIKYTFKEKKILLHRQIDLLFGGGTDEVPYFRLADVFWVCYSTGVSKLKPFQEENFAIYLIQTPNYGFSPFVMVRVEKGEEGKVKSTIFPAWFDHTELKFVNAAKKIKEVWSKRF